MSAVFHFPMSVWRGPPRLQGLPTLSPSGTIVSGKQKKAAHLFCFWRYRPALSLGLWVPTPVQLAWLLVNTDQLFLRTNGCLREARQRGIPTTPAVGLNYPLFSNAGASRPSTGNLEGLWVACGQGWWTLGEQQVVFSGNP